MDGALFLIQLLNGIQLGVLLFLVAAGLTLVFGIMDFVNLAHGALYMVGAFFCASLTLQLDSFVLAIIISLPGVFLVGYVMEILIIRHLYDRNHLDQVLATFGLILVFDTLVHIIWGPAGLSITLPDAVNGRINLFGITEFPVYRLLIIAAGLLVALALYLVISRTRIGMLVRAGASNRVMAGALGVDIQKLFRYVFAAGAMLAGFGGMIIAPITEARIGMGSDILLIAFVVIIIGGIGSIRGAFIASIIVGLIDTMGRSFLDDIMKLMVNSTAAETAAPAISAMLVYILMAAILYFRPQGLFPPKVR
ncbi:MAG: branched-chain amino acid ABC transporter permease [Proteobacteria bacterium]|nr:MAG: branched-chain amino acid ABC transporter permease [Pseudomonadota bacterium]